MLRLYRSTMLELALAVLAIVSFALLDRYIVACEKI